MDLRNRGLTTLRGIEFPPSLEELYISGNQITSLVGLPDSLIRLFINDNQITSLVGLPPSLEVLYIDHNQITSLEGLPPSLKKLYIDHNQITSIVGFIFPVSLTQLTIEGNPIVAPVIEFPSLQRLVSINITSTEGLT